MKVNKITKQTDNKYINMYKLEYENGALWTIASRRNETELSVKNKNDKIDAVNIIPLWADKDGDKCVVITKEFRYPINDYVYSFPAGLVEDGEDLETAAVRELKEEIGAEGNVKLQLFCDKAYSSDGLTDENSVVYLAEIEKIGQQDLQDHEDINVQIVKIKDLKKFVKNKKISLKLAMYAAMV